MDRNINRVQDLINETSRSWKEPLIREIFVEEFAFAIHIIPLPQIRQVGVPRWMLNPKGILTIKSAYLHD